jgi:hypothetical protein
MATPITPAIIQRRANVARLHDDGIGQRDIARQLGITKDVVWRDIRAIEKDRATATATPAAPATPVAPTVAPTTPQPATPIARHGATPAPTSSDSVAEDRRMLWTDLAPGLRDDLYALVDRITGDLPPDLSRILRDAARGTRDTWRDKLARLPDQPRDTPRHDTATDA